MEGNYELDLVSYIGGALSIIAFFTRSMMPLRVVALASNFFFLTYAIVNGIVPSIWLNSILIPLNFWRLQEIRNLVRSIENAKAGSPVAEWLLPHMTLRQVRAGEVLFHKGDVSSEMLYLSQGRIHLPEIDVTLQPGALLGEIGIFSPDQKRTLSAVCAEDCKLYSMTTADVMRLYYQNPKLGFHLMRLIVARLMDDVRRKEGSGGEPAHAGAVLPGSEGRD